MKIIKIDVIDIALNYLSSNKCLTYSGLNSLINDIADDYYKHGVNISFISVDDMFNTIVRKYKEYIQAKFNSGDMLLIKKKDFDFKYNKVHFKYLRYRKEKLKYILK
jgi:hypothetical protein